MSDHLCYRQNLSSDFLICATPVSNQEGFMYYFWEVSFQSFIISTWNILMTQLDLQNLCLNLLKMTAVSQQISLKSMFIQNEINLFTFSTKMLLSFLLLCSPFLNSLLGFNPVGFYLLKDTPFKVFFISKLPIPVLIVSLIPFLVSLFRDQFCVPNMITSAVQHRHCQSWFKQGNSHNPVLPQQHRVSLKLFSSSSPHFLFVYLPYIGILIFKNFLLKHKLANTTNAHI